jgi:hypothetical protein
MATEQKDVFVTMFAVFIIAVGGFIAGGIILGLF